MVPFSVFSLWYVLTDLGVDLTSWLACDVLKYFTIIWRGIIAVTQWAQMNTLFFHVYTNEKTLRNSRVLFWGLWENVWTEGFCVNTLVLWFWMNWVLQNMSFRAPYCTSINCTAWLFKVLTLKTYQMPYYFHSNF